MADSPNPRDLAFLALDAAEQAEQLMRPEEGRAKRPSFTELYRYVNGQRVEDWGDFSEVMRIYPDVAADFEHLLKNVAFATMPQLVAAAGEAIQRREHDGYVLTMTESHAQPDQIYLSIETGVDLIDPPRFLFMKAGDKSWHELPIPPMTNGRAQIVLEKEDQVVLAFGQPNTVVYIR